MILGNICTLSHYHVSTLELASVITSECHASLMCIRLIMSWNRLCWYIEARQMHLSVTIRDYHSRKMPIESYSLTSHRQVWLSTRPTGAHLIYFYLLTHRPLWDFGRHLSYVIRLIKIYRYLSLNHIQFMIIVIQQKCVILNGPTPTEDTAYISENAYCFSIPAQSMKCANNGVHYSLKVVFVCALRYLRRYLRLFGQN